MANQRTLSHLGGASTAVTALALLVALALPAPAAAQGGGEIEDGQLWLLRQYRVPGCEPMPRLPTVFNWLLRKALAADQFIAASADCGQEGRRGAREGWTYVFWSEQLDEKVARVLRQGEERFGITQLAARRSDESFSVRSSGYEAFVLVQLPGDQGPVRVWAAGDVAQLEAAVSVIGEEEFELLVQSTTFDGETCTGRRRLQLEEAGGPRESLACG